MINVCIELNIKYNVVSSISCMIVSVYLDGIIMNHTLQKSKRLLVKQ